MLGRGSRVIEVGLCKEDVESGWWKSSNLPGSEHSLAATDEEQKCRRGG